MSFDFFILAQSWGPTFCCVKPEFCATLDKEWSETHLCLHGLWPSYSKQRKGKGWPKNCKTKHQLISKNVPKLAADYAPNYAEGLAKHEWKVHGSCSNLSPEEYFKEGLRLMLSLPRTDRGTPKIISENIGKQIPTRVLQESFIKKVGVKVTKNGELEEITSCFAKRRDNGKVGEQIDCPEYILQGMRNNICSKKGCRQLIKITKLNECSKKKKKFKKQQKSL